MKRERSLFLGIVGSLGGKQNAVGRYTAEFQIWENRVQESMPD